MNIESAELKKRERMTVVPVAEYNSVISSTDEAERISSLVALLKNDGSKKWIQDCIHEYLVALASFVPGEMSYSLIEIPKIKIAEAVLVCLGYPLEPLVPEVNPVPPSPKSTQYKKVPIPEELRWEVFERDGFKCVKCDSRRFLRADHIIAESKGGLTVLSNLQTLCRSCNSKKGAK